MSLSVHCPRCAETPVEVEGGRGWRCPRHGSVMPLWRPAEVSYAAFAALLVAAGSHPTYLPWPMGPGWRVSDVGVVAERLDGAGPVRATVTGCSGPSTLDGPVDVLVVTEEPGTGLGGRVAGLGRDDPGPEVGEGPPAVRVRVESHPVALWPISTSGRSEGDDRSVLAGEAFGRWLWLVLRPASAALWLREDWFLGDVSAVGPPLVALTYGGPVPPW